MEVRESGSVSKCVSKCEMGREVQLALINVYDYYLMPNREVESIVLLIPFRCAFLCPPGLSKHWQRLSLVENVSYNKYRSKKEI